MRSMSFAFFRISALGGLMSIFGVCLVGGIFLFSSLEVYAMGKKYSEQGAKLTAAMNSALLSKGFCKTPRECYDLLPGTLETDTRVLVHFYGVGEKNHPAFLTVVALALTDGIRITGGVPITINAFRETQDEYRESGLVIKNVKPFVIIEVNK